MPGRRPSYPAHLHPAMIVAVLTVILVSGIAGLFFLQSRLISSAGNHLAFAATGIAEHLASTLQERIALLKLLTASPVFHSSDVKTQSQMLERMQDAYPAFGWVGVVDHRGQVLTSTNPLASTTRLGEHPFSQSLHPSLGLHISKAQPLEELGGQLGLILAAPLKDAESAALKRTLIVCLRIAAFETWFKKTAQYLDQQWSSSVPIEWQLLTHQGQVLIDSRLRQEGQVSLLALDLPSAQLTVSGQSGFIQEEHRRRHVPVLTGFAPVHNSLHTPGNEWGVLVRADESDILPPIHTLLIQLTFAGALLLIPLVGMVLWSQRRLVQEVEHTALANLKYRSIFENAQEGIFQSTPDGSYLHANQALADLYGYHTPEDLMKGLTDLDHQLYVDSDRREEFQHLMQSEGIVKNFESQIVRRGSDCTKRWISENAQAVCDDKGELLYYEGTVLDITDRKHMEDTLREGEARVRSIINNVLDGLITIDEGGLIRSFNPAAERMFGYSEQEAIGQNVKILMPSPYQEHHDGYLANYLRTGQASIIGVGREVRGQRRDGEVFPLDLAVSETWRGGQREFIGICRDITTRKWNERLQATEHMVTKVLAEPSSQDSAIPQILRILCEVFGWDIGVLWTYDEANKRLARSSEWIRSIRKDDSGEPVDQRKTVSLGVGLPGCVFESRQFLWMSDSVAADPFPFSVETQGGPVTMAVGCPILIGKDCIGVLEFYGSRIQKSNLEGQTMLESVASQIGLRMKQVHIEKGRRHLEDQMRQTERLRGLGTLAGGIAHDFNNLLSPILGYAELSLQQTNQDHPVHRHIREVLIAGNRAKDLVRQIVNFSCQTPDVRKTLDLSQIIQEVLELLSSSMPPGIEIQKCLSAHACVIVADPSQMHQVVMNLLVNGIQAMQGNEGVLEIRLEEVDVHPSELSNYPGLRSGPYIRLCVKDQGIGMNPEIKNRIFDWHFTTKESGEGSGLGLAVVQNIIANHDGMIYVESATGQGSTFMVYLPKGQEFLTEETLAAQPISGIGRILFVDDEVTLCHLGQQFLEYLGYEVDVFTGSLEALKAIQADPLQYDLALVDYHMPVMDGIEFARELFKLRTDIPVILCSGFGRETFEVEARRIGVKKFLTKPFDLSQLGESIQEVLGELTIE